MIALRGPITASLDPSRAARVGPRLAACAAVDALAAAMLLVPAPLSPVLTGLAAATLHAAAVVLLLGATRARASRVSLGAAATLAVPGAGVAVAAVVILAKGRERVRKSWGWTAVRRAPRPADALHRLGHALSPCDALDRGNEEQRLAALSTLARRADRDAIALLRRASTAADPDLALAAALALDEIGERFERDACRFDPAELRRAAG